MTQTKTCTMCKEMKLFAEFSKKPSGAFGLQSRCKACTSVVHKAYLASKTPQEKLESGRLLRERHADAIREKNRKWRAKNPEKVTESVKKWTAKNKERSLEIQREWCKANPEKMAVKWRARRALELGAEGKHTTEQIRELFQKQKGRCAVCHDRLVETHADHIVPLIGGGSNDIANIQLLCPHCNLKKGAKDPFEFMQSRGKLL